MLASTLARRSIRGQRLFQQLQNATAKNSRTRLLIHTQAKIHIGDYFPSYKLRARLRDRETSLQMWQQIFKFRHCCCRTGWPQPRTMSAGTPRRQPRSGWGRIRPPTIPLCAFRPCLGVLSRSSRTIRLGGKPELALLALWVKIEWKL